MGICHLYVDESANLAAALPVIRNAKVQRPSVCNALDTLLVHRSVAVDFLPQVVAALNSQLEWMQQLGYAFATQQPDVMASVQRLRHQAQAAG